MRAIWLARQIALITCLRNLNVSDAFLKMNEFDQSVLSFDHIVISSLSAMYGFRSGDCNTWGEIH